MRLHERRLDDDVAEVLLDADVALEQAFDDLLVVIDATRQEAQQVVVAAADEVAFQISSTSRIAVSKRMKSSRWWSDSVTSVNTVSVSPSFSSRRWAP